MYSMYSLICSAHLYVLVDDFLQTTDFHLYVLVSGGEAARRFSLICSVFLSGGEAARFFHLYVLVFLDFQC